MSKLDDLLTRLNETGGFTYDLAEARHTTEGFAVSTNPELTNIIDGDVSTCDLLDFELRNLLTLCSPGKVFGAWLDTESGKTYLDVVTVVDTEAKALELAVEHGELVVYDIAGQREIRTGLVK